MTGPETEHLLIQSWLWTGAIFRDSMNSVLGTGVFNADGDTGCFAIFPSVLILLTCSHIAFVKVKCGSE